jgi:hypothetical protein
MPPAAFLLPVTLTCSVLLSLSVPSHPAAAVARATLTVSRHHVLQRDEVQLFGRATGKAVMIERSAGDAAFHPYLRVLTPGASLWRRCIRWPENAAVIASRGPRR